MPYKHYPDFVDEDKWAHKLKMNFGEDKYMNTKIDFCNLSFLPVTRHIKLDVVIKNAITSGDYITHHWKFADLKPEKEVYPTSAVSAGNPSAKPG